MKKEIYFYHCQFEWQSVEDAKIHVDNYKCDDSKELKFLGSMVIDIPEHIKLFSENDFKGHVADSLKNEKQILIANHVVELNKIDDKIQQLLALPSEIQP